MAKGSVKPEVFALIIALVLMAYAVFQVWDSSPRALPQRVLPMSAPEQIAGGGEKVIYAKEPLLVEGVGTYTMRGYLKASQPLSDAIGVYRRTQDPADDPTCKALTVPSPGGDLDSSVYVCEKGKDKAADVAKFTDTKFASFCFPASAALGVNGRREFWIGVGWNPFLPHPLTLVFDNLAAVRVINLPFEPYPCDPVSRWPGTPEPLLSENAKQGLF
jgi:hypothetical protein